MSGSRPAPGKRAVDLAVSAVGLALTAPVQLGIACAVRIALGRPVLFRQVRPGRDGRPFTLLKFRTMRVDDPLHPLPDGERTPAFGRWLRSTSLDELPTLLNVLRGDMSLVGPRPLLVEYLPLYSATEARRHEVRPGITGLAQVSGRNELGWPERLALDVTYVQTRSAALDARILLRTIGKVVRREGITPVGEAAMPRFAGSAGAR